MAGLIERFRRHVAKRQRQAEIRTHLKANGGLFNYDGLRIELPASSPVKLQHALITADYEKPEVELIKRHLPAALPVIELGGCLGVVSAVIERKLAPGAAHVIVEGHPALAPICDRNARAVGRAGRIETMHAAVAYGCESVRFEVSTNLHGNRIATAGGRKQQVDVPATTLQRLVDKIDAAAGYTLVCDIEGAEYDVLTLDGGALAACRVAIVEIHPDVFAERGETEADFIRIAADLGLRAADRIDNTIAFVR